MSLFKRVLKIPDNSDCRGFFTQACEKAYFLSNSFVQFLYSRFFHSLVW